MDEEYKKLIEKYRLFGEYDADSDETIIDEGEEVTKYDVVMEVIQEILDKNTFENALDRDLADELLSVVTTPMDGGYPLLKEKPFEVNGVTYSVAVYGVSEQCGCEDMPVQGIIFIKENKNAD